MTVFDVVENVFWTLPGASNRWPLAMQEQRMYERAVLRVLLRKLDDDDSEETLKMLRDELLVIDDHNPNAPGVKAALNIIEDLCMEVKKCSI